MWYKPSEKLLELGQSLSISDDPEKRILAAKVLAQEPMPDRLSAESVLSILLPMLEREADTRVLCSLGSALQVIGDPRAVKPLVRLRNHPNSDVRFAVVQGLLGQHSRLAITMLINLSSDPDPQIRDWATFGIARSVDIDTLEVRMALKARLEDEDDDTRGEALLGLALRGDPEVIEALLSEMKSAGSNAGPLLYDAMDEATKRLNDPRLIQAAEGIRGRNSL